MDDVVAAVIAALAGGLITLLVSSLPGVRKARGHKREVYQQIVGRKAGGGLPKIPSFVERFETVDKALTAVAKIGEENGVKAEENARIAAGVATALPRIERQVSGLRTSQTGIATTQAVLSRTLQDHMMVEETVAKAMGDEMKAHQVANAARQEEMKGEIHAVHSALLEHAETDLTVAKEIRGIATEARQHADAARVAAEAGARAAESTQEKLGAISTAVGAEEPSE